MNAPFRINGGDEKLEGEFVKEAVSGVVLCAAVCCDLLRCN
jgi:hypothetical protein